MSEYPEPCMRILRALELYHGWSRYWARSPEQRDREEVISRESEGGRFWDVYALALADEQFFKEVDECCKEFRIMYPEKRIARKELKEMMIKALTDVGWKPVKKPILQKVAELKRKKKEEIRWLKESIRKRKATRAQ